MRRRKVVNFSPYGFLKRCNNIMAHPHYFNLYFLKVGANYLRFVLILLLLGYSGIVNSPFSGYIGSISFSFGDFGGLKH